MLASLTLRPDHAACTVLSRAKVKHGVAARSDGGVQQGVSSRAAVGADGR